MSLRDHLRKSECERADGTHCRWICPWCDWKWCISCDDHDECVCKEVQKALDFLEGPNDTEKLEN